MSSGLPHPEPSVATPRPATAARPAIAPRPMRLRELRIRCMPGFLDGGFRLDDLSPGINIIFGPNASGKTTTAEAVRALLWPERAPVRAWVFGRFRIGDEEWSAELEAGHEAWQRAGSPATRPPLPPADAADRYILPLHELLHAEDEGLAAAIVRESAGGYDLDAAVASLGFRAGPSQPRSLVQALVAAREERDEARREQAALRSREQRLGELQERLRAAEEAARRVALIERALEHAGARAVERQASRELADGFDQRVAALRGDEAQRLARLAGAMEEAERDRRAAMAERDRAVARLAETGLPEAGLPETLLDELGTELHRLEKLEDAIQTAERDRAAAVRRREDARRALGPAADEAALANVDRAGMDDLAAFARRAERLRGERAAAEAQLEWLGETAPPEDLERVRAGIVQLAQWLRTPEPAAAGRRLRAAGLTAAAMAALAGLTLAATVHWAFAGVAIAGVLLGFVLLRGAAPDGSRAACRSAYQAQGLEPPESWTDRAVAGRLDALQQRLAEGRLAEERARQRERLAERLRSLAADLKEVEAARAELVRRLGAAPATDEATLAWLAERIGRWQDAAAEAEDAATRLAEAERQRASLLGRAGSPLRRLGHAPPASLASFRAAVEDLGRRRRAHAEAGAAILRADDAVKAAARRVAEHARERAGIFEALGLEPDSDATVRSWCDRLPEYEAVRRRLQDARRDVVRTREALEPLPPGGEALLEMSAADLSLRRERERSAAAERDALAREIGRIEGLVRQAKEQQQLETALARVERGEAALRAAMERDMDAAAGHAVAEFVRRSRDEEFPAVFHRARELLASMTAGRYTLVLEEGPDAAFRAQDAATGIGHALDELSSATRVQVLMAVRIAFVETVETLLRPPLLLDETLANSDDRRAPAILNAVVALAREGRQVFYFTAQRDEVAKWRGLLAGTAADVAHTVIELADARVLATVDAPVPEPGPAPVRVVPAPDGMDPAGYAGVLGVPPLRPGAHPGGVHLWYLVDEPEALHQLLCMGVETWGMLEGLARHGAGTRAGAVAGVYAESQPAARALARALELAAVGRGRPLDRAALQASRAVSDTFLDRAVELCRELDGDAARLLDALANGALPRFRADKAQELREYLEENGYLDSREPLGFDEIRRQVIEELGAEAGGRLDPVLDRLRTGLQLELAPGLPPG